MLGVLISATIVLMSVCSTFTSTDGVCAGIGLSVKSMDDKSLGAASGLVSSQSSFVGSFGVVTFSTISSTATASTTVSTLICSAGGGSAATAAESSTTNNDFDDFLFGVTAAAVAFCADFFADLRGSGSAAVVVFCTDFDRNTRGVTFCSIRAVVRRRLGVFGFDAR